MPDELTSLGKAQKEFELFTSAVLDDLETKVASLKKFKASHTTGYHERSFATLQIFMLQMYSSRIESFRSGSVKSIENICAMLEEGEPAEKVNKCVDAFHCGLAKMKTRMKHMIDVSDKYAVVDIFDTINILNEASKDLDSIDSSTLDKSRRSVVSLGDRESFQDISTISTSSDVTGLSQERKSKTLRSLSDHLWVLRRSYLK